MRCSDRLPHCSCKFGGATWLGCCVCDHHTHTHNTQFTLARTHTDKHEMCTGTKHTSCSGQKIDSIRNVLWFIIMFIFCINREQRAVNTRVPDSGLFASGTSCHLNVCLCEWVCECVCAYGRRSVGSDFCSRTRHKIWFCLCQVSPR